MKDFGRVFENAGFQCFLVGGALRNMIASLPVTDYDFATDATPQQVMALFRRTIPTGIKHGTVTVFFKKNTFEVTTFRSEGKYTDSRRPDRVLFIPSIYEDLKRRDFTINSLALNLSDGTLLDPHNGREDLKRRLIRAIGNPLDRFSEDGLRLIRACRFASQLDFMIEANTFEAMIKTRDVLWNVSAERIRDEFVKILESPRPSLGINLMERTGILAFVLPELQECKDVLDIYEHSILSCDFAENDLVLRLSALFHDLGKVKTLDYDENNDLTFHNHEKVSEEMVHTILKRLKFPKAVDAKVSHLVKTHMFNYEATWTDAAVRRFIYRVGKENIYDLFSLRCADAAAKAGHSVSCPKLQELKKRIDQVLSKESAFTVQDLDINGNELHALAGIPKGPVMGQVIQYLLEAVLDDPYLNTKEQLINLAKNYYETRIRIANSHEQGQ